MIAFAGSCETESIAGGALLRLTDDTGILQHSRFAVPNREHGYCVDDNARALMLTAVAGDLSDSLRTGLCRTYAGFVEYAWNAQTGSFRNFMGYDRRWLEAEGSADSNGRTLWALAVTERNFPDRSIAEWAASLTDQVMPRVANVDSPRTAAFLILALNDIMYFRGNAGPAPELFQRCARYLVRLYDEHADTAWNWFEPYLSYDNYRLSEALIVAGTVLDDDEMVRIGLNTLQWLVERQNGLDAMFRPVATAEFGVPQLEIASEPSLFDQQPLEAWAAIDAAIAASRVEPDDAWFRHGEAAYAWFLGANDAGEPLADPETGECCDGIGRYGINRNRGAESVLAWQFAQRRIMTLRSGKAA